MLRRAFAANLLPSIALWLFALATLLGYYFYPSTQHALDALARFKTQRGLAFSMPAQAFASGLLPFLFQHFQSGTHRRTRLAHVPYLMAFWACSGAMVDAFYRFQAVLFGNNAHPLTVLLKVVFDMGLYSPFIAMPLVTIAYAFKDSGFSLAQMRKNLGPNWYRTRVIPIYLAALLVWTPAVAVLYALPLGVQFPFQATVACFWSLILVIMTDK